MKATEYAKAIEEYESNFLDYIAGHREDSTGLSTYSRLPSTAQYERLEKEYGEKAIKAVVGSSDTSGSYAIPPSVHRTIYYDMSYFGLVGSTSMYNTVSRSVVIPTVKTSGIRTRGDTVNDHYRSTVEYGSIELNSRPLEFNVPFSLSFMEDAPDVAKESLAKALAESMVNAHHERIITGNGVDSITGIVPAGLNGRNLSSNSGSLTLATLMTAKFALPWRARTPECNTVLIGSSANGAIIQQLNGEDMIVSVGGRIKEFDENVLWYESDTLPNNILVLGDMKAYALSYGNMRLKTYADSYSGMNGVLTASVYSAGEIMYPNRFQIINIT